MHKVAVYRFRVYDITIDSNGESRRWATREFIERIRGEALEGTGSPFS